MVGFWQREILIWLQRRMHFELEGIKQTRCQSIVKIHATQCHRTIRLTLKSIWLIWLDLLWVEKLKFVLLVFQTLVHKTLATQTSYTLSFVGVFFLIAFSMKLLKFDNFFSQVNFAWIMSKNVRVFRIWVKFCSVLLNSTTPLWLKYYSLKPAVRLRHRRQL